MDTGVRGLRGEEESVRAFIGGRLIPFHSSGPSPAVTARRGNSAENLELVEFVVRGIHVQHQFHECHVETVAEDE